MKSLWSAFMSLSVLLFSACGSSSYNEPSRSELASRFAQPSGDARPWTFWYWMFGNVTREGITTDLEAMREVGLGGAYLMPIKSPEQGGDWAGNVRQLSPEWWDMVHFSMQEADRLGLQLGMHICDGFALAGGPWITPAESMQKVVYADTVVDGGVITSLALPQPKGYNGYYEDIAVYAIPYAAQPDDALEQPKVTCGNLDQTWRANPEKAVRIDEKGTVRSSYPCYIDYTYTAPVTVSCIEVEPNGNLYQVHRMKLSVSNDGKTFHPVKQMTSPRQGWQNYDYGTTHAIPPTTARIFRFEWTPVGSEPGSEDLDAAKWKPDLKIKKLHLHTAPRIHQWEGKVGLVWRVAEPTTELPSSAYLPLADVHSCQLSSDGTLSTQLPEGKWRLVRIGHTATGHTNATGGDGKGLECDKFSREAVQKQFDNWFARAFSETDPALARRVLKYMHVDSWECGSQNWSKNFAAEFQRRRGYDLMPYLPLMVGIPMESAETSERVLRDVRETIGELVLDVFYDVLAGCADRYDCRFSAECVCPTMVSDGLAHYRKVDLPMGEYWLNSPTHDKPNDMLDAISGAHIYGKNVVQAEGFTEVRGVWDETPAMIKPLLDRNYALGINKLFFHVFTHNPNPAERPGMTLDGIGLFFQPSQTWWRESAAFVDYAARSQALLQYGHPVVDIAVFAGDEVPRRAILPDRLVPVLPGIFGEERVKSEEKRLANEGQPLRVRPVGVRHTANMADPEDWVNPLRGYAYDTFNPDALLRHACVDERGITTSGGTTYRVLVLPPFCHYSEPLLARLDSLKALGTQLIVPTLPYTEADFSAYGLERDVEAPADVAWTHRQGKEMDIYFIANQQDAAREVTVSLRDGKGRTPELWDATTGRITRPATWSHQGERTELTLSLPAHGSMFVVFPMKETTGLVVDNVASVAVETLNASSWNVTFEETGKSLAVDQLFDWSKENDDTLKYYSGRATYATTFSHAALQPGRRIFLNLGEVRDVATVRLNGHECGVAWMAPYEVDITDAIREGENKLEIDVTNTWANALRGADKGKAPFAGIRTNARYRMSGDRLLPAGLLGPLSLVER